MVSRAVGVQSPGISMKGTFMKLEDIAKEAEIDLSLLPIQTSQVWFPLDAKGRPMPSGWALTETGSSYQKPSLWQIGKPPPDEASFSILAMFSSDAEVRVYASGPANKAPRRYTLSKTAPLIGVERMAPDVFSSEIEEEWQGLKGEEDPQGGVDEGVQGVGGQVK